MYGKVDLMYLECGLADQLVEGHDAEDGGLPHTRLNVVVSLEIKLFRSRASQICVTKSASPFCL